MIRLRSSSASYRDVLQRRFCGLGLHMTMVFLVISLMFVCGLSCIRSFCCSLYFTQMCSANVVTVRGPLQKDLELTARDLCSA